MMQCTVPQDTPLLEVLAQLGPDSSKTTLRSWLEKGRVSIDGRQIKNPKEVVKAGQKVAIGPRSEFIKAGIEVLFEDKDLVVINKPHGLLSVATDFQNHQTAHAFLKKHSDKTVYPVHRLDRETSGVMVFAYTEKAKEGLKEQFFRHDITREYCAIVDGAIHPPSGTWKSYLVDDDFYNVQTTTNTEIGKLAITHYETVSKTFRFSMLKLVLETGRKNQIRVHCKEATHPVVGDKKYGSVINPIKRLCLHARKLSFTHPVTGKRLNFESPIPEEFYTLVPFKNN